MVILIFKSGKVIFTGGKTEVEIRNSLELLQIYAHDARKDNSSNTKNSNMYISDSKENEVALN